MCFLLFFGVEGPFSFFLGGVLRDNYTLTPRKKFDALQEISETPTPNDEYENFNAHLEAAAEYIPTKQRAKSRVP